MTRVLIADDDEDIRTLLEITLSFAGFDVLQASNGLEAVELAYAEPPDVIVLDRMMPQMDGIEALKELRRDARTSHIPVLMLTARAQRQDAIEGLDGGADDYMTKPFDTDELLARLGSAMRRAEQQRTRNPLSGLPGNESILQELSRRIDEREPFALLYIDLDRFKPFNDYYGFLRGDEVLLGLARLVGDVQRQLGDRRSFLGHIGGDDFVLMVAPIDAEKAAQMICDGFDAIAPGFHDPADAAAGSIVVSDRQGVARRFGLLSLSIGIASSDRREFEHQGEAVALATEMKRYAKARQDPGSSYAFDRRTEDGDPPDAASDDER